MAVREFNGTSDYINLDDGIIGAFNNGGGSTVVMVVRPTTIAALFSDEALLSLSGSTTTISVLYDSGEGALSWGSDGGDHRVTGMGFSAATWQVIGFSKAGGTAVVRMHRKALGSGVWTHTDSAGSAGTSATDCDLIRIACFRDGSGFKDMRLATAAFFNSALTDTDFVNIESNATTDYLLSLSPQACWDFNQDDVATSVTDLTGNGANEIGRSGTTVITGADPAWTFHPAAADTGLAWIRA